MRLRRLPLTGERVLRGLLVGAQGGAMRLAATIRRRSRCRALGAAYRERVLARGAGVPGREFAYGDDPLPALDRLPAG